jgi:hypothetical protein
LPSESLLEALKKQRHLSDHSMVRANLAPLMFTHFFDTCDTDGIFEVR